MGSDWVIPSVLARKLGWRHSTLVKRLEVMERGGVVESRDRGRGREWRLVPTAPSPVAGPTVGDWQRSVRDGQESAGEGFEESRVEGPDWEVE